MSEKPRQETLTLFQLLQAVKDEDIRKDADTQRYGRAWKSKDSVYSLIRTVLSDGYIPDILLAQIENLNNQEYIIDGLQRITYLEDYRFYNKWKLPRKFMDSVVTYVINKKDEYGRNLRDENGAYVKEEIEYDIAGKSYDDLPQELKKRFDMFQIHVAKFYCKTMKDANKLIEMYNNHTAMNSVQKSFTKAGDVAAYIRPIVDCGFFADTIEEKKQHNGTAIKIIFDSLVLSNHRDNWKSKFDKQCEYYNNIGTKEEIDTFAEHLDRLYENVNVVDERIKSFFAREKNAPIFLTAYERFLELNKDDSEFENFLIYFSENLTDEWKELDENRRTRDTKLVNAKYMEIIDAMNKFFDLNPEDDGSEEIESPLENEDSNNVEDTTDIDSERLVNFIKDNVNENINPDDVEFYKDSLDDYIKADSKIYDIGKYAVIALLAYAYEQDSDEEFMEWADKYRNHIGNFGSNQRINYLMMKRNFDAYIHNDMTKAS